jgi:hypothetical protein
VEEGGMAEMGTQRVFSALGERLNNIWTRGRVLYVVGREGCSAAMLGAAMLAAENESGPGLGREQDWSPHTLLAE